MIFDQSNISKSLIIKAFDHQAFDHQAQLSVWLSNGPIRLGLFAVDDLGEKKMREKNKMSQKRIFQE
jgi:hypothetical protein